MRGLLDQESSSHPKHWLDLQSNAGSLSPITLLNVLPITSFPSRLACITDCGQGLVSTTVLPPGTTVARFEGPVIPWKEVAEDQVRYALLLRDDEWLIPTSDARYINHSCDPNCSLDDSLSVVTTRPIDAGEQLTISYNMLSLAEWLRAPQFYFWDERWSFDCHCGAPDCSKRVDRYRIRHYENPKPVVPGTKLRLAVVPGKGRGVLATAAIKAGEIFERAPIIISPDHEWPDLEKTSLFHYCFAWGPKLEHAAIGLGYASLYNHSYTPNATYIRQTEDLLIHFVALRDIASGEEITVNYNNDPHSQEPVWFDVKGT